MIACMDFSMFTRGERVTWYERWSTRGRGVDDLKVEKTWQAGVRGEVHLPHHGRSKSNLGVSGIQCTALLYNVEGNPQSIEPNF